MTDERKPYAAPAMPAVVAQISEAEAGVSGTYSDGSGYTSFPA